jgi:hypothetical protein
MRRHEPIATGGSPIPRWSPTLPSLAAIIRQNPDMTANSGPRLLIATGAAAAQAEDVPPVVRSLIASSSEILVMTPLLVGRLEWYSDDFDRARHEADERLTTVLGQLESIAPGAEPGAEVGDETPLTAFADAIAEFQPDHILLALRSRDHAAWQERHLLDRLRERFHIPMTVFELDRTGHTPREAN